MSATSMRGKVYQYGQYGTGNYGLILYDFDIGSSTLKQEHKDFLNSRIIPTILNDPDGYDLTIMGFASKRWLNADNGQVAYSNNQNLALERGYAIHDYIISRTPGDFKLKMSKPVQVYRENYSVFPEDERERAVSVRLKGNYSIPDIKEIPVPDWTKEFDIKLIAGFGGNLPVPLVPGASAGFDHLFFEIKNTKGKTCMYKFFDLNMGGGIPLKGVAGNVSGSWTAGPPSHFSTKLYMPVDCFYGEAVLMQDPGASAGRLSLLGSIYLSLRPAVYDAVEMFDFRKTNPEVISISSGSGFGFNPGFTFGFPGKFEKMM